MAFTRVPEPRSTVPLTLVPSVADDETPTLELPAVDASWSYAADGEEVTGVFAPRLRELREPAAPRNAKDEVAVFREDARDS